MPITTTRRRLLAGSAAALALTEFARAQGAVKPRLTVISQWSAGSDGAAITALGKKFEEKGGIWQHSPVPGFTTEMMNKLRAQIMAGDPPACSQLKGPEIAAWSKIAPTVNLDTLVASAGYEKVVAPDLAKLHKPGGKWISLPLQIYSTNMLFLSKRAMDKAKADKIPVTWADFNALADKMKASAFNRNTGLPLSLGPGAITKSSNLKPALRNTPCAHPPMIIMPMSPSTKRFRLVA